MALQLHTPETRAAASQFSTALLLFFVALILAAAVRLPLLGMRVMHTDEAVQAQHIGYLQQGEGYTYNPKDGHGPLLVYSTVPLTWLARATTFPKVSEKLLRMVPALYGIGIILMLALLGDGLGRLATAWAALLAAASPMMVFYSRYYIMEVPLVFFTTGVIACGWRYFVSRNAGWLIGAGVCIGCMHATKETFILQLAAMFGALIATRILDFFSAGAGLGVVNRQRKQQFKILNLWLVAGVAVAVSFTFYSAFYTNLKDPFLSLQAYAHYWNRAGGSGHEKPWWYYFTLLFWNKDKEGWYWGEIFIGLLAVLGILKAFLASPSRYESHQLQRFLACYALFMLAGYSIISYKTPWCILGAEHALVLLAGVGAASFYNVGLGRFGQSVATLLLVGGFCNLGLQLWRGNVQLPSDPRNPYVYTHTDPDLLRLVDKIKSTALKAGGLDKLHVEALLANVDNQPDYWPLPWYLRDMPKAGYLSALREGTEEERKAQDRFFAGDVIIVREDESALLGSQLGATHSEETFLLRPEVPVTAFFRKPPEPKPAAPPPAPVPPPPAGPAEPTPDPQDPPTDPADAPAELHPTETAPAPAPVATPAPAPAPTPAAPAAPVKPAAAPRPPR